MLGKRFVCRVYVDGKPFYGNGFSGDSDNNVKSLIKMVDKDFRDCVFPIWYSEHKVEMRIEDRLKGNTITI